MTEGYGNGRMNNEGLNNLEDFRAQQIDILLMGSSHMEGVNVAQTETMASRLNSMFNKTKYVYNLGFSTHAFLRNANNLEAAIKFYKPNEYIVIEFREEEIAGMQELKDVVDFKLGKLPSFDDGIASYLQRMPYLRLGYRQIKLLTGLHVTNMLKIFNGKNSASNDTMHVFDKEKHSELLELLVNRISKICTNNGLKLIIFRHPQLILNKDGTTSAKTDIEYFNAFKEACNDNGVYFIDMADVFMEEYKTNHILPHGFYNTAVGVGHLNKNGHYMIANELYNQINKIERGK
jgi:hypothetical protein